MSNEFCLCWLGWSIGWNKPQKNLKHLSSSSNLINNYSVLFTIKCFLHELLPLHLQVGSLVTFLVENTNVNWTSTFHTLWRLQSSRNVESDCFVFTPIWKSLAFKFYFEISRIIDIFLCIDCWCVIYIFFNIQSYL